MEKYALTDAHRDYIRKRRINHGYSAEFVSEQLKHHKSWLGQIERGRLNSIKKDDFENLLSILLDIPLTQFGETGVDEIYFGILNPDPPEIKDSILNKISETVESILPIQYSGWSPFIKAKMKDITNIYCKEQNNNETQFIHTLKGLSQLQDNAETNSNYSLLFLSLPFDKIFKKYEGQPQKIMEIYDNINKYIESCLDDTSK